MAKITKIKPKNETIGPTVIRRVLKMSGLNSIKVVEPVISKNPITIITKPNAISNKLVLAKVSRLLFSRVFLGAVPFCLVCNAQVVFGQCPLPSTMQRG